MNNNILRLKPRLFGYSCKRNFFIFSFFLFLLLLLVFPFTRSTTLSLFGLVLFESLVYAVICKTSTVRSIKALSFSEMLIVCAISVIFMLFTGWYLSLYHFVPTWDSAYYWSATLRFNSSIQNAPHMTMLNMIQSVNTADYNQILCWVMSFPVMLFPSWAGTFFIEQLLVIIPVSLLFAGFVRSNIQGVLRVDEHRLPFWLYYLVSLLTPIASRPIFSGYLDGIGFLLFIALVVAIFDKSFITRKLSGVIIGLGIACVFLLRRWFVFPVIGLAISSIIYWIVQCYLQNSLERTRFYRGILLTGFSILLGFTIPLATIFRPFVVRSFGNNYVNSYQGWTKFHSFGAKFINLFQTFGGLWFIISWICLIVIIVREFLQKNRGMRYGNQHDTVLIVLCSYIGGLATLLIFWRIQDFTPQHWYVIIPFLLIGVWLPIFQVCEILSKSYCRFLTTALILLLCFVNWLVSFSVIQNLDITGIITTPQIQKPIFQSDVSEKLRFVEFLRKRTNGQDLVYFATANSDINSSLPETSVMPNSLEQPFPVASADVDLRDGFNTSFFDAKFVVCSKPVALHMSSSNEKVVSMLNKSVSNENNYLGHHYKAVSSFDFSGGRVVTVYERTSSFSRNDVEKLKEYFSREYPADRELFADRFDNYLLHMATEN